MFFLRILCQVLFLTIIRECTSVRETGNSNHALYDAVNSLATLPGAVVSIAREGVSTAWNTAASKTEAIQTHIKNLLFDECVQGVDAETDSLDKYIYLRKLQKTDSETFYKCLSGNVDKMLPIIYAPVVGKACKNYKRIVDLNLESGLIIDIDDQDIIQHILEEKRVTQGDVRVVVVTDGERTLGLGDMGANGMGVPVGKLALFSALGGIHPKHCLPVALDVGTNNEDFLGRKQDKYVGKLRRRESGEEYDAFIEKFIQSVVNVYGSTTLIQFEDFASFTAYPILKKYQDKYPVINDDIQGTAAIALAGILSATSFRKTNVKDAKFLFVGAGRAALGISKLLLLAMGGDNEENRKKIYMLDIDGLLTEQHCEFDEDDDIRKKFCHHAEEDQDTSSLEEIVKWVKPNVLIGVASQKGIFTDKVLQNMMEANKDEPAKCLIIPLSSPQSKSECTAQDAYTHAKDCLFLTGSPFAPVFVDENTLKKEEKHASFWFKSVLGYEKTFKLLKSNNDNIFPGTALGIMLAKMKTIPDDIFYVAAKALADECVKEAELRKGNLYPQLKDLKECSVNVAAAIVKYAFENGLTTINPKKKIADYKAYVREQQYDTGAPGTSYIKSQLQNYFTDKCVKEISTKTETLDAYIYLRQLQVNDENEFYKCLIRNVDRMLPIIYTPVVGKACKNYRRVLTEGGEIGLTLNINDHEGKILERLQWWKAKRQKDVKAIVVTDGGRILGLGDLGANGMGIPVGKLALYSALGGVHPEHCLPVTLDVGTNNIEFKGRKKHKYTGIDSPRVTGDRYWNFIDEFMKAVVAVYGRNTLIQFEDFSNPVAQPLLEKYENTYTVFNDDIQGTAAVAVAGILGAAKHRGSKIEEARVLFAGAGTAALGIATLLVEAMKGDPEENSKKIFMKDIYGLLTKDKCGEPEFDPQDKRRRFCHEVPEGANTEDLAQIILWMKPNVLIGVSGAKGIFTKEVLQNMAKVNGNMSPIIMPLSNPTSRSECTAEEAHKYAKGCLFASGSPFAPVKVDNDFYEEEGTPEGGTVDTKTTTGKVLKPKQCNNDNIFPGVALGIILAKMNRVPNHVFLLAAETLAYKCLTTSDFDNGSLYPAPADLRKCSVKVAAAVMEYAYRKGLSDQTEKERPDGWRNFQPRDYEKHVIKYQYHPK